MVFGSKSKVKAVRDRPFHSCFISIVSLQSNKFTFGRFCKLLVEQLRCVLTVKKTLKKAFSSEFIDQLQGLIRLSAGKKTNGAGEGSKLQAFVMENTSPWFLLYCIWS